MYEFGFGFAGSEFGIEMCLFGHFSCHQFGWSILVGERVAETLEMDTSSAEPSANLSGFTSAAARYSHRAIWSYLHVGLATGHAMARSALLVGSTTKVSPCVRVGPKI